jgi:hypothetical protein
VKNIVYDLKLICVPKSNDVTDPFPYILQVFKDMRTKHDSLSYRAPAVSFERSCVRRSELETIVVND